MNTRFPLGLLALIMSMLACEPVIAIGKNELLCLLILIIVLLGPSLYKFVRRVEDFRKHEKKDK
jgi:hypothetical protein